MRALADDLPLAAVAGVRTSRVILAAWVVSGLLAGLAGVLAGLVQTSFDPQLGFTLLLPIFAAVILGGIGNVYGALVGGLTLGLVMELSTWPELHGGVDPTYKPVVAFAALIRRPPAASAGPLRKSAGRLSTIASFGFWSFVGIVAGIYTLFALGVQVQFGFAGLLNFGQVAFMGIGAYTMAILVVKEDLNMWLAAGCGVVLAILAALLLGLPTLRLRADYFAITTIAFSEILRYVATNEDRLTGGSQGTINLAGIGQASQYDGAWQSFLGKVERNLHVGSDVAMLIIVWTVAPARGRRRDAADAHALGPGAEVDPRGRGRGGLARQERVPLQAPGARARRCPRRAGRRLLCVAVQLLQPGRLRAADHLLRLDDRHPRRARPRVDRAGRGARVRRHLRRHALLRLPAVLATSTRRNAPTCA